MKKKYDKILFCRFQEFWGLVHTFTAKAFSETRPLMHLNQHIFRKQQIQKYLTYEAHCFFQNIGNLMEIKKKQKKMQQKIGRFLDNLI